MKRVLSSSVGNPAPLRERSRLAGQPLARPCTSPAPVVRPPARLQKPLIVSLPLRISFPIFPSPSLLPNSRRLTSNLTLCLSLCQVPQPLASATLSAWQRAPRYACPCLLAEILEFGCNTHTNTTQPFLSACRASVHGNPPAAFPSAQQAAAAQPPVLPKQPLVDLADICPHPSRLALDTFSAAASPLCHPCLPQYACIEDSCNLLGVNCYKQQITTAVCLSRRTGTGMLQLHGRSPLLLPRRLLLPAACARRRPCCHRLLLPLCFCRSIVQRGHKLQQAGSKAQARPDVEAASEARALLAKHYLANIARQLCLHRWHSVSSPPTCRDPHTHAPTHTCMADSMRRCSSAKRCCSCAASASASAALLATCEQRIGGSSCSLAVACRPAT
ncbi:hypothetical protein ABPG75_008546 [Micractinium tetrahymenae]